MTRTVILGTQVSDEVLELVETVQRLGAADQERILRIVRLLALMPKWTQGRTKSMLKKLIHSSPSAIGDDVDQFIEYLEDSVLNDFDDEETYAYPGMSGVPN